MKKYICFITALIVISITLSNSFFAIPHAHATDVYARVITDDTPFYKNADDELPLFFLPYTYYVKVISYGEDFTHVECYGDGNTAAIDGFVPTEYLFSDGLNVENPFVVLDLTTVGTTVLYEDATLLVQSQYIFADRSLHYYGSYVLDGVILYYVGYNNRLGYVKETDVFPFSIPNHPNELTFLSPEDTPINPEENPKTDGEDFFGIKVAVIACLIFAGLIALFIALSKKPDKAVAAGYYDDNDYQ